MGTSEPGKAPEPVTPGVAAVGETRHVEAASAAAGGRKPGAEDTVPADSAPGDGGPVAADPTPEPRPSGRIDRYLFGPELGRGGMGRVVEATDTRLGRKVAVKEALPRGLDLRRRFEREVRITARLEHPSIVPLYDAGLSADGNPFYVMRKVSGRPLDKLIADAKTLGDRLTLLPHMLAAIDAIAHAHRRDVVHRDMKPANVLVGEHGETVVIDWGLAKALGEDDEDDPIDHSLAPSDAVETQIGAVFGTPGFMAPEQARGESLDARSDVYALGATLYQLLSGRPPHSGTTATEVIDRALVERPPPLRALVPGVPPELVTITDKALTFDRRGRYADAGELAEDVRRFLAGQLVAAHRYTTRQRIGRFLRRHRAAVAVATLAAIALGVGGAVSVHSVVKERDRAMHAEHAAVVGQRAAEEARDLERDRADELLITQARALASVNPTAAIAALKLVSPKSPRLRNARLVAVAAAAQGAAWGYPGHGRVVGSLEISADGHHLLSAGESSGFRIQDLDRHEEVLAVDYPERVEAIWVERGTAVLVAPLSGGLVRFDAETGVRTAIPWVDGARAVTMVATAAGDRAFVSDQGGAVYSLDLATRTLTLLEIEPFEQVTDLEVAPDGSWLEVGSRDRFRIVRAADGRILAESSGQPSWLTIAADGRRGAAIVDARATLVEVSGDHATITALDPVPVKGKPTHYANQVLFRGSQLLVSRFGFDVEVLGDDGAFHSWVHPDQALLMGAVARGGVVAYGNAHGNLVLATPHQLREIRAPSEVQLKRVAARPDSRYVAIAADDLILVWDLDRMTPASISVEDTQAVLFRDDNTLFVSPRLGPWELIDVRSGAVTPIDRSASGFNQIQEVLIAPDDGRILISMLGEGLLQLAPGATRVERIADGPASVMALLSGGRFAYGTSAGAVVYGTNHADRRTVLDEPAAIVGMVADGDGAVVMTTTGAVIRLDGAGREVARTVLPEAVSGVLTVDGAGLVVLGIGDRVVTWNGARVDDVATLDAEVAGVLWTPAGIVAFTRTGNTYAIGADRKARRVLARTQYGATIATAGSLLLSQLADQHLVIVDLQTSERAVLPSGTLHHEMPAISPDGRRVAFYTDKRIWLWSLDAPLETNPDAWLRWLDEVTNAMPSTTPDVVWPWQQPA